MINKETFIKKLENEVRILKHLASKATTAELLDFRFSNEQRTTRQWFAYLATIGSAATKDIINDDASGFETFMDRYETFDFSTFEQTLDADIANVIEILNTTSDEKLLEEKTMFGRFTETRAGHMLGVYNWYIAYKTQIFLQLKAAGLTDLQTSNLWGGVDTPKAA